MIILKYHGEFYSIFFLNKNKYPQKYGENFVKKSKKNIYNNINLVLLNSIYQSYYIFFIIIF